MKCRKNKLMLLQQSLILSNQHELVSADVAPTSLQQLKASVSIKIGIWCLERFVQECFCTGGIRNELGSAFYQSVSEFLTFTELNFHSHTVRVGIIALWRPVMMSSAAKPTALCEHRLQKRENWNCLGLF